MRLLGAAVADAEPRARPAWILGAAERDTILRGWNDTAHARRTTAARRDAAMAPARADGCGDGA